MNRHTTPLTFTLAAFFLIGCAAPPPPRTGFISDYSRLEPDGDNRAIYLAPELKDYRAFIIDPVEVREVKDPPVLTPKERAEVADYLREAAARALQNAGYAQDPGTGTGSARVLRIRLALTDIHRTTWWLNLHPGSKATGAGAGGAAMEAEALDATTGQQLAAAVLSAKGNQFEIDTFSKLDDVKDVIDQWAREAEKRLTELRAKAEE